MIKSLHQKPKLGRSQKNGTSLRCLFGDTNVRSSRLSVSCPASTPGYRGAAGWYWNYLLFLVLLSFSACADLGKRPEQRIDEQVRRPSVVSQSEPDPIQRERVSFAPWEVWFDEVGLSPDILSGDELLKRQDFVGALEAYDSAFRLSSEGNRGDQIFVRKMGALLRLGRSSEVLMETARRLSAQGKGESEAGPLLSLIVAFAHEHQRDRDQAFVWLSQAFDRAGGRSVVAERAAKEAERLVAIVDERTLKIEQERWGADRLLSGVFSRELIRRAQGLIVGPVPDISGAWFGGASVSPGGFGVARVQSAPGELVIGVLLPFSGRYSTFAENIRRGVEVAVDRYRGPAKIRIVTGDTAGDPAQAAEEYRRLVVEHGAAVVIGPLLVKTSEEVATAAKSIGVPFVCFTKKRGIPELGREVFRLGATSEDQVRELVEYATSERQIERFAVLAPEGENGAELAAAFSEEVRKSGATVVTEERYQQEDQQSVEFAVARVTEAANRSGSIQAVFIADTLDTSSELLSRLRQSNSRILVLGPASWNDTVAIRGLGPVMDGAMFATPFFTGSSNPQVGEFIDEFRQKYGATPDLLAAQGYDAATLVLRGATSGDNSPERIINSLEAVGGQGDLNGATGRLTTDRYGDIRRRLSVVKVTGSELVEVINGGRKLGFVENGSQERNPPEIGAD